jgi:outer membrane receptor protein involved in Fe transport
MFVQLKKKLGLVSAIIILSLTTVYAQNSSTVSGTITDTNGEAIVGATVRALNIAASRESNVETDGAGKYEFTDLRPGSYRISAVRQGFATNAETILVEQGANLTQNFSLSPGVIEDTVTVTAGKGNARIAVEVPQTVTVTTAEDLERQRPRSTFEAIERAPNIIVRETNPARERPRLRGLDSSRVLIVIDGEKLNNARTDLQTGLSPSIIDVTQLESAEVVAGAGSSLYGSDSLAGTINLITKGPTRPTDDKLVTSLRADGNYSSNGEVARGYGVFNISNKTAAFRASYSQFSLKNYSIGSDPITIEQVLAAGRFYTTIPTSIPNATTGAFTTNAPNGYPVFSVAEGGELFGGGGGGVNKQFDLWFFPTEKLNFRGRYIGSDHRNLGDAFSGPPYETQERFNPFRNYSKFGFRTEYLDLAKWLPRASVNFYWQKLSFPQAQFDYANVNAASATALDGSYRGAVFTGAPSRYFRSSFTSNKNTITSLNIDLQGTFAPVRGLFVTVGGQNLKDDSRDEFVNYGTIGGDPNNPNLTTVAQSTSINGQAISFSRLTTGASSPNTTYRDRAAFFLAEFDRFKYLRLTGSMRVDNWTTIARPSAEFPLGVEFGVLTTAFNVLQTNPGSLASQVSSVPSLISLANRAGSAKTDSTTLTGSVGGVLRLPYGINPYIRYGTSYREPSITERYIIRNFNTGIQGFYALVVGNPNLEPEEGRNLDLGVKLQGRRYNATFGYFRNELKNLNVFRSPDSGNICAVPPAGTPALTFPFLGCAPGRALINYNARINQGESLITGFEGTAESSFALGDLGSINPFISYGTLKGTNKSPTPIELFIIDRVFNNSTTPVLLRGSRSDVPLGNITPFRVIGGAQFTDARGRLFMEYAFRHQSRVKRVNPTFFNGATLVNFGTLASLNDFTKHTIKGGYSWRTDRYRVSLNAGIDNLTDKLYWEHFQNAPAPGRSFIFGFTTELFNLFGK